MSARTARNSAIGRLELTRLQLQPPPVLTCGPLVRHVSRATAVIWLEVREALEIEVEVEAEVPGGSLMVAAGVPSGFRAFTVAIEGSYYAWVALSWLVPDTWYRYRVIGHRRDGTRVPLWPDNRLSGTGLPSVFKTLPSWSLDTFRMAYGSCRKGYDPLRRQGAQDRARCARGAGRADAPHIRDARSLLAASPALDGRSDLR